MRLALVLIVLCLAAPAAAFAQSNPFGPLPPAQQATPEPTPVENPADQGKVSRPLLLGIAGAVAIAFLGIGFYISRDARRNLTEADREALENRDRPRTPAERKQVERTKAKARAKRSAQKQARKKQRR